MFDLIYRFCRYRLLDADDIEDATNQIFLQALEGLRKSRVSNLRSWLFSIAHNVVTDRYRSRRSEIASTAYDCPAGTSRPRRWRSAAAVRSICARPCSTLSLDQRRVVELRLAGTHGSGDPPGLGKSAAWVDATQFRAVQTLRAVMASPDQDR